MRHLKFFIALVACGVSSIASAQDGAKAWLISPPAVDVVRSRTMEWVATRGETDKSVLTAIGKLWSLGDEPVAAEQLFDLTIKSFSLADVPTRDFLAACHLPQAPLLPPEAEPLSRDGTGAFYRANLSLFYGRYLVHRQMYEEALDVLDKIEIADVVDPATLLFLRAVCQHQLLMKAEGLKTIEQLLKNTVGAPVRYTNVATLMQYDLEALKDNSLDEVSRKMTDVERRLQLGRTGEKVQKKEDEIVATLDELIKKIEQQQGGGGGGGNQDQDGENRNNRSDNPANDSRVKGSTAPGEVDKKKLKNDGGWGSLPEKQRAEAKNLINREFPSHYRQAIEEYTRKQAARPANSGK